MKLAVRVVLVLVVLLIAYIQTRPNQFRVERSTSIQASPEAVFAHVNDLHAWAAWSPWEKLDPNMQRSFSGPDSGQGAVYHWSGNSKAGAGSMTITAVDPGKRLAIDLEFEKPYKASNVCTFEFVPEGAGTRVNWVLEGRMNFMFKAMSLVMNMDKTVGGDFERGLASLKTVAEAAPATAAPGDSTAKAATP